MTARRTSKDGSVDAKGSLLDKEKRVKKRASPSNDQATIFDSLAVGEVRTAIVKRKYRGGLTVDIGGIDASLSLPNLGKRTYARLKCDDKLQVVVIHKFEDEKTVEVGYRQLRVDNNWTRFAKNHAVGSVVVAKVIDVDELMAHLDCGEGVEAFLQTDIPGSLGYVSGIGNLTKYFHVGDTVQAVIEKINPYEQVLGLRVEVGKQGKVDNRIPKRHHPAKDMKPAVGKVIEAVHALRDASKKALQEGLSLAGLESPKCREIADAFLELVQTPATNSEVATTGEAAALLGKKRAASLTSEHQQKAANARSEKLSAKRRSEIASAAAAKRWGKDKDGK